MQAAPVIVAELAEHDGAGFDLLALVGTHLRHNAPEKAVLLLDVSNRYVEPRAE